MRVALPDNTEAPVEVVNQNLFAQPASVITSKPAIHDHLKTGQRDLTQD